MGRPRNRPDVDRSGEGRAPALGRRRCAVYTRKSSDEGLEQSFNSLHAQRDACEAYVASQKHEGWVLLPEAYDDGGLSGGSMDRPALRQLLADIRAGLIDIVVVYKVDRLTRSLADFAKLTELFDAHATSFVSVTQSFNTSTSMGRLTLNVLLSFAQFEREVAGERIRDKIALSKRRGMWMGGLPPLGYDGVDRALVVNEAEADTVRLIFRRYLELGSIAILQKDLHGSGIVSKHRRFADGREVGGVPIGRGALYQILRNRLYRGEIAHRGEVYGGNHAAIVDEETWSRVQDLLIAGSGRPRGSHPTSPDTKSGPGSDPAPLAGVIFDEQGHRLTPTYATRRGRRYRYYVSAPLVRGNRGAGGIRVPAPDLESLVASTLRSRLLDPVWVREQFTAGPDAHRTERLIASARELAKGYDAEQPKCDLLRSAVSRVVVGRQRLVVELDSTALAAALVDASTDLADEPPPVMVLTPMIPIVVEAHTMRCGKEVRLVLGDVDTDRRSSDPRLAALVADAHRWFEDLRNGRRSTIADIAAAEHRQVSEVSRSISLAFLAPDIVETILTGRQPATLTPERLRSHRPLPLDWDEQRALLID